MADSTDADAVWGESGGPASPSGDDSDGSMELSEMPDVVAKTGDAARNLRRKARAARAAAAGVGQPSPPHARNADDGQPDAPAIETAPPARTASPAAASLSDSHGKSQHKDVSRELALAAAAAIHKQQLHDPDSASSRRSEPDVGEDQDAPPQDTVASIDDHTSQPDALGGSDDFAEGIRSNDASGPALGASRNLMDIAASGTSLPTLHMISTLSIGPRFGDMHASSGNRHALSMTDIESGNKIVGASVANLSSSAGGITDEQLVVATGGSAVSPLGSGIVSSPPATLSRTSPSGTTAAAVSSSARMAHTEKLSAILKKSEGFKDQPSDEIKRRRAAAHRSMDLIASRAARKSRDTLDEIPTNPSSPEPQFANQRPISTLGPTKPAFQSSMSEMPASEAPSVRLSGIIRSGSNAEAVLNKIRKGGPVTFGGSSLSQAMDLGSTTGAANGSSVGSINGANVGSASGPSVSPTSNAGSVAGSVISGSSDDPGARKNPGADTHITPISSIPANFASININSLRKSRISMMGPHMSVTVQPTPQQPNQIQKPAQAPRTFKEWYVHILNESDAIASKQPVDKGQTRDSIELHHIFGLKNKDVNPIDRLMWAAKEYEAFRRTPEWGQRQEKIPSGDELHDDMAVRIVDFATEGRIPGLVYDDAIAVGDIDILVSGTRKELLDALIFPLNQDLSYSEVFFATYRFFMPAQEVLDCLIGWYNSDTDASNTESTIEAFLRKYRKQIQTRAVRMLLAWIRNHWHDFHNDHVLYNDLTLFVNYLSKVSFANHQKLTQAIREQRLTWYTYQYVPMFPNTRPGTTEGLKPWIGEKDVDDLAQNLTMIDHLYFRQIKPDMYLQLMQHPTSIHGGGYSVPFKLIMDYCLWFRTLVGYTVTVIAKEDNPKKKTNYIKRFIKVAKACKDLSNYNTMFAIIYGLKRPAVLMWTQAWESLAAKYMDQFRDLDALVDPAGGYATYMDDIRMLEPPAVPLLLPYIQDILEAHRTMPFLADDASESHGYGMVSPSNITSPEAASAATWVAVGSSTDQTQRISFQRYYHIYSIAAELEIFRLASYQGRLKVDRESNLLLVNHIRNYALVDDKALGVGLLFSSSGAGNQWNETAAGVQGNKAMKRATMLFNSTPPVTHRAE